MQGVKWLAGGLDAELAAVRPFDLRDPLRLEPHDPASSVRSPTYGLPVISRRYAVRQIRFPVRWRRELAKKGRTTACSGQWSGLRAARIARFPVKFPVCREFGRRQVRSPLRRQPRSPAVSDSLQRAPHRPGNPGFSCVQLGLQAPALPISGAKWRKVSGLFPKNSRFAETIDGDWFDHDCRPMNAVDIATHNTRNSQPGSCQPRVANGLLVSGDAVLIWGLVCGYWLGVMASGGLKDNKSMSLSVRLLRIGRTIDESLRDDHELEERPSEAGRLFVGQAPALPPTWFDFVSGFATGGLGRLVNQSCAAVLFLEVVSDDKRSAKRIMALSFGTGHHSLDPDACERSFGLKVVLNSVARSNLRSLDIATLDATTFQKRIQASRDADLQGFGVDVDRDLLRLAAGTPRDNSFARSLAGKDALTLHTKTSPDDVIDKCKTALKLYQATDYKKDFGFIDFVTPVRQQDLLEQLDGRPDKNPRQCLFDQLHQKTIYISSLLL
jgi:hypothetical protein